MEGEEPPSTLKLHYSSDPTSQESSPTLLIHILSINRINSNTVKSILKIAWQMENEVYFQNMDFNTFLVTFEKWYDKEKLKNKGPWSVKGNHLIVSEWNPNIPFENIQFTEIPFWIQVQSLPPNCMNIENAKAIGNIAGRFMETDIHLNPQKIWKKFLRIRVAVNVHQNIKTGFFFETSHEDQIWIPFKYERSSDVCYTCGHLDHTENFCSLKEVNRILLLDPRSAFGPWLRASN